MKSPTKLVLTAVLLLACNYCTAFASHFRYGHYFWSTGSGNTVIVKLQNAFRRDGYGCISPATLTATACSPGDGFPQVGDIVLESIGATRFNWGDGTQVSSPLGSLLYKVTSILRARWLLIF